MDMGASHKANPRDRLTMAGVAKDSHNPSLKDKMVMDSLKDNLSPKDKVMVDKDNHRDSPNPKDRVMEVKDNPRDNPNLKDKVMEVKDSHRDSPSLKDKVMEDNLKVSPKDKLTTVGVTKDKASHKIRDNGANVATRASPKVNPKITTDMGASPKANLRDK